MDTPNSQKKSPRSSTRNERQPRATPSDAPRPVRPVFTDDEDDLYMDRSIDLVARVRAAREAAQREMESFGDPAEYEITLLHGHAREEPAPASQPALAFQDDDGHSEVE